jgi:hypothetical protein
MNTKILESYLQNAKGIAWDECHKIYVLMDDEQVELMREYEYEEIITSKEASPKDMMDYITSWYGEACGLRFIEAVSSTYDDPNAGFVSLVPQVFADEVSV